MRKLFFLGTLFLSVIAVAIPQSSTAQAKTDWHRIKDEASIANLTKKISPLFGKTSTKTVTDTKKRVILTLIPEPKHSGEDSIINVIYTEYDSKGSRTDTKLQLHQWHDRWYTFDPYPDKAWLYETLKKITDKL